MLIAVTGGTGYLGAHTVRALLAGGHRVRLLVGPDAEGALVLDRLAEAGALDVLSGDIRNTATIEAMLDRCDAVLHARRGDTARASRRQGPRPGRVFSSYSALFPPPNGVIGPDTPTADGRSDYAKTKGYADRVARRLQQQGAPVVVTYPSSVVGPAFHTAPGVTERGWAPIVRFGVAPRLRGGMQMIDVRDVADVHTPSWNPDVARAGTCAAACWCRSTA